MTSIFIKLLNMSISASWLILAVILLRVLFQNAPKWIRCILWGLVAVRLICPISIESIFSLLPSAQTIPQDIMYVEKPVIHTGVAAVNSVVNPYLSDSLAPGVGDSVNPMQVVMSLGTVIWVVGMIGMLVYVVISYLRIRSKVAASIPMRENIYLCDYIDTPFVLGTIYPRIYLPSALAQDHKADFVIAHEKAHIKRGDHWWKPIGFLLLTVYWYNPVIWVAYILLCRDIELACDEYVIGNLGEREKKTYSDALLACSISMNRSGFLRSMISACPLAFGEVGVKDRVKAVLHYKKPAFWLVILGLLACIVAAICFLTDPTKELHAPEPFGHSYRVEEVVYDDGNFSFTYTKDTAPRYSFTSDYVMYLSGNLTDDIESNNWEQQFGKIEEVKLTSRNFDRYLTFFAHGEDGPISVLGVGNLRRNTEKAWRIDVEDDKNGVFYYLILTKQGEVYLAYGYDFEKGDYETKEGSLIRWVFKLARTDILDCNAVSEGCHAYIQPTYYPEGFDWDYEQVTKGYINERGVLVFTADWDTDSLVVSEDYYNNYNSEKRSGSTFIERETYTLERNEAGQFELSVELRSANGDMAVYFIKGPVGVYVMKIMFVDDEALIRIEGTLEEEKEKDLSWAIADAILKQYTPEKSDGLYHCASFILLEQEEICGVAPIGSGKDNMELVTVYGIALHEGLGFSGATFHEVTYNYVPVKLQFQKEGENGYILKEAWFPEKTIDSWDSYQEEMWKAFSTYSEDLATSVIYAIQDDTYVTGLRQQCYEQAVSFGAVDTDTVIEGLLEEVVASPGTFASGVKDYVVANETAYKELIHYGKYTLWYCFGEFLEGGQTDLRGQIMAAVCRDIMSGLGEALLTDTEATHGQEWFDLFYEIAGSLQKQYTEEEMKDYYYGSWLLLQKADREGSGEKELIPIEELDWVKILKDHLRNE